MSNIALLAWYPGPFELLIIGGVALLLFGHRLPSMMRSLGRGVVEFKKGVQGIDDESEEGDGDLESARSRKDELDASKK